MTNLAPIIIKKKKVIAGGGHHGGAWKVAYADFVTAMMAFFLLMWLLNATSEDQRKGLADFFDPAIPISRNSAGGAGMLQGDSQFTEEEAAGSRDEGVRPRKLVSEPGVAAGDNVASPDEPAGAEIGSAGTADAAAPEPSDDALDGAAQAGLGLDDLAGRLAAEISSVDDPGLLGHFSMRMTPEGLVLEVADLTGEPLFGPGSARARPLLETLLSILVPVLSRTSNDLAISGHTDASPFAGQQDYSNWELSAERASVARRLIVANGLDPERITRISGRAATELLDPDPLSPRNRRIAITLLRQSPPN